MRVIDLFAGLGGFSTGAASMGAEVVWAANHWPAAVEWHSANHPNAVHACQDLHQTDWSEVPRHDVLLASPACQGHSRARGKERPKHDRDRSTAWAVVSCAEFHRPEAVVVENVEEFRSWVLYPAWCAAMQALGYALSEQVIDAADCGVPQHRARLFVVGVRGFRPFRVPQPQASHVPVSNVIRWASGRWSDIDRPGRAARTLARVGAGRAEHGSRFLLPYYGSARTGRSIARPVGTLTTRDRYGVVDGDRMRMLSVDEQRECMGFPAETLLPPDRKLATHLLGNAVCPPVAAWVLGALAAA